MARSPTTDSTRKLSRRDFLSAAAAFSAWTALRGTATADAPSADAVDDFRFVRRATLALCGRIPAWDEAAAYAQSRDPQKKAQLVDRLLASEDYIDFRTMHLADALRVKSEFPINLWPNAVYVYHAALRAHVAADGSWRDFARRLLAGRGSNFTVPEANFLRASAVRTPEGLSETVTRTFWGKPEKTFADHFRGVTYTPTREWKEEIVAYPESGKTPASLAARITDDPRFAEEAVRRTFFHLFGTEPDDATRAVEAKAFAADGFRLKPLYRRLALSQAFAAATYAPRRLEAEVLEDALCTLTGTGRAYVSVAPEPFTRLPPERKTVCIEDGSITGAFLLLFGRPARDTGDLAERDDTLTAKQRLYLMNSATLYRRLRSVRGKPADLFHRFLTREMHPGERKLFKRFKLRPQDIAWCLVNSEEFLFRT